MTITSQWVDLAGKHRVTVDLHEDGGVTMLKFQQAPTPEELQAAVDTLLAQQAAEAERQALAAAQAALEAELYAAFQEGL